MAEPSRPRILITRLSALGDCVLTLPVLCALRDHFPEAEITWLVQPESAPLLRAHGDLDDVITVRRGWLKSPAEIRRVRRLLRERSFDVVVDPQSLTKSSFAGWLSGCRRRIGLSRPNGREAALFLNNVRIAPADHVVRRYLNLLQPLGIRNPVPQFRIPRFSQAEAAVREFLSCQGLDCGFAVLNVGAGWPSKRWPVDRFARVARHLRSRWGLTSVINWFGPQERRVADSLQQQSQGAAVPAPEFRLPELAELLRAARGFVGADTGPLHLAAAVGTPCIGLFGTTRHQEIGPTDPRHILLQEFYQSGTTRQRRQAANHAMCAIGAEQVTAACDVLFAPESSVSRFPDDVRHRDHTPAFSAGGPRGTASPLSVASTLSRPAAFAGRAACNAE